MRRGSEHGSRRSAGMMRAARGALAIALMLAFTVATRAADVAQLKRGEVLFRAADCTGCHTDAKGGGALLAGGRKIDTLFGTFYGPNITPDQQDGIGGWSEEQFRRALREGIGRDGGYLYPVFPFASFTGMSDGDIADLYAYLRSLPPVAQPNQPDVLHFPFGWRFLLFLWRALFFHEGPLPPDIDHSPEWNRGRYLAEAVVHCQQCHTPRNFLGGLKGSEAYSGNAKGIDGMKAPNITSDPETGIGKWSVDDIALLLKTGQTPDMDFVGSGMAEVVKGTAALSDTDRRAIAAYVRSIRPIVTEKHSGS
ncbi:MAG TPA: cytochrome c [Stellaceae bacterium]|nr:cytochrome c [Stellaceae bacterium]